MKRFCSLMAVLLTLSIVVVLLWFVQNARLIQASQPRIRALWVTRFEYSTPDDVQRIISNVAAAGFTDVFFQIRGNGTAYYPSRLEPWAYELSGKEVSSLGTAPGWNPLQLAIDTARPLGLRIHAYMNVLPGWKGLEDPPESSKQLWTAHPDWFMVDSLGCKMLPVSGWYAFINPVMPEVRAHLRGIVRELCDYDVAGIHLDYIRYPYDYRDVAAQRYPQASEEEILRHSDFSYDPVSMFELKDKYGKDVSYREIRRFRCDSVTRVVREISAVMQEERPGDCLLSASVLGDPIDGRNVAYQDSGGWVRKGLVDWVVQMNYATRPFEARLKAIKKATGRKGFKSTVVVGIYCKNDIQDILAQIDKVEDSGCRGLSLFSYGYLFDQQHQPTEKGRMILQKFLHETP